MSDIKIASREIIEYGFVIEDHFYNWEILEELANGGDWYFVTGKQEAEPLVKAGIAEFTEQGASSVRGTEECHDLYTKLREDIYSLWEKQED